MSGGYYSGKSKHLVNGSFRVKKYGFDYSGLAPLPLTNQKLIGCNPYVRTCGIAEVFEQGIELCPNPTIGVLNIVNVSEDHEFAIWNTTGELLQEGKLAGVLDLSGFVNGFYFVEVKDVDTGLKAVLRGIKE